jgi:hypothetical protein
LYRREHRTTEALQGDIYVTAKDVGLVARPRGVVTVMTPEGGWNQQLSRSGALTSRFNTSVDEAIAEHAMER